MSFRIQTFPNPNHGAERRYYFLIEAYIDEATNAVRATQDALWTGEALGSLVYDGDGPVLPDNITDDSQGAIHREYSRILSELLEAIRCVGRNA